MSSTRRSPVRMIVGVPIAIVSIASISTWLWVSSIAAERNARLQQQVRDLHREVLALDDSRLPLHGEALPGNAWSDYSLALAEIAQLGRQERTIDAFYFECEEANVAEIRALIGAHPKIADHLRLGARRSQGSYPFAWEQGVRASIPDLYRSRLLGRFVASRARILAMEGNSREAALGILDLFQLAGDLASNPTRECAGESARLRDIAEIELKELLFSEQYPRLDLAEIAEALERLDQHFYNVALVHLKDALLVGFELLKPEEERREHLRVGLEKYGRYAYSRRIADADAFELILADVRRVASKQESNIRFHPFICRACNDLNSAVGQRSELTAIRLLRVAVHYRSAGEILELQDPFGDKLGHEIHGSDLRVWSVGQDGVDHGGDNFGQNWSRSPTRPVPGKAAPRLPRDFVLQVER